MKKIFKVKPWAIMTGVFAVLFTGVTIGSYIALNHGSAALNSFFGTSNVITVDEPNAKPITFFSSDYDEVNGEKLFEEDSKMIEEAAGEGAVLLWNKNSALPLKSGNAVSLFSHSSVDLVESGSGSGWVDSVSQKGERLSVNLKDALSSRDLSVNQTLWDFYSTGAAKNYTRTAPKGACTEGQQWRVNEAPWSAYTNAVKTSFSSYKDAAIVVISRSGGEYSDLHYSGVDTTAGNYLSLTTQEKELLSNLVNYKKEGTFSKLILLLNTANPIMLDEFSSQYFDSFDAGLWIGQPGTTGANAVADILVNNVNPSGRLPDTYAYDLNSAPSTVNDGNYVYDNASLVDGLVKASGCQANRYNTYMVYQEGIYVGYKYYETRYADLVEGNGNASSAKGIKRSSNVWNYDSEVAFPFGYGLSYTNFEYENFSVKKDGNNYKVTVTVRNVGDYAGKEVVQVYMQKPYTDYDRENNIEKAAIELVGFAKTANLEPNGGEEKVTVTVKGDSFKTYDANNKKTYIVEEGDYYLTVGTDAHVAVNNVLKAKNDDANVSQNVMGGNVKEATLGAAFTEKISLKNDFTTYSVSAQTGAEITNRLDGGDINKYDGRGSNSVTYLSRNDWNATYPETAPKLALNADMVNDLKDSSTSQTEMVALLKSGEANRYYPENTHDELPNYGVFRSGNPKEDSGSISPNLKEGDVNAFMFIEAPLYPERYKDVQTVIDGKKYSDYWTDMWEQLLDQMTFEEQAQLCANAYHQLNGVASISLDASKQENGPVGITKRSDFGLPNKSIDDWHWVAYPCSPLLSATFNTKLVCEVGKHMSEDMLYLGYNGIYGPGANMHRTPFGGRNFEYPSEDSFLAGEIAYYESNGIENKGCMAYAKHFALNDTETNRRHVGIWSNEQATREIYLSVYERVFSEGGASATMNSFTRVGTRWNGSCYAMMTEILRNEWGWDGINISDWQQPNVGPMSQLDGIMGGTDSFDGNHTGADFAPYKDIPAVAWALRDASRRIIYTLVRTNVMNGKSPTSRQIEVTPWWKTTMCAIDITLGVVTVLSAGCLVASIVLGKKSKIASA